MHRLPAARRPLRLALLRPIKCALAFVFLLDAGRAPAKLADVGPLGLPPEAKRKRYAPAVRPYRPRKLPDHGLSDTMPAAGKRARGFYLTPTWVKKFGARTTARMLKRAHLNAVVLDLKDDFGHLLYPSRLPQSEGVRYPLIKDPAALVKAFHDEGIYVIARIVCFKDSRLPVVRPDLSVRIGQGARRLFSAGAGWIDAYSAEVRDYVVGIALEAESFGFDEVQFDYVRFPKGKAGTLGVWLHQDGRDRASLIASFLEQADRALRIPLSVDIYGLTTLVDGDPRRLGQTIELMAKYADAVSPMMYANGMNSYFKENRVTERVYDLIHCGLWRARQKAKGIVLRPFLQSYPASVSFFGPEFILKQIDAARRAGSEGFLFWNASMKNGVALAAIRTLGSKRLDELGSAPDLHLQRGNVPTAWCKRSAEIFDGKESE